MLRLLTALTAYLLMGSCCFAQQKDSVAAPKQANLSTKWMIKFAPLSILESDGGLNFSVEYLTARQRIGFQLEIQPVFFTVATNGYKVDQPKGILESGNPTGIKLRPEIRYYFKGLYTRPYNQPTALGFNGKPLRTAEPIRVYVAADLLYKYVQTDRTSNFLIRRGGIQYTDPLKATYTDIKQVYGVDFKIGSVSQSFPNPHWWVEAYAGIGGRVKRFSYRNIPDGAVAPDRLINFFIYRNTYSSNRTTLFRIAIPAGLKLIYKL